MTTRRISSPASTGGAGVFFEQNVAAYWLAQLLVSGIPPILIRTTVTEAHFQMEHLGWNTDDFLIVCERSDGEPQQLVGQVKRGFTVSATDEECRKTICDFWKDYNNTALFSRSDDRLVLVTQRGTNTLLSHFVGLLDCARSARDGTEFERRLRTDGFISKKAVHYFDEIQKIVAELEESEVTAVDLWLFLRLLHVLSLDLHTSTRQTEAQIKSLLAHAATDGDAAQVADATWNSLLTYASEAMDHARSLKRTDLPEELRTHLGTLGGKEQSVLRALREHTAPIIRKIRSTIGRHLHLRRISQVQEVFSKLETTQVVLVSGPAGSGKSVIGKDVVSSLSQEHFVFAFRVEEFAQPHIDSTLHAGQIPTSAETLSAILAAQGRKVILVESVERLLEKTTRDAFSDLVALAAIDRSLSLLLTCRDYSVEQVKASFLQPAAISHTVVSVPPLGDAEMVEVETAYPSLAHPLNKASLRNILRNPYFLDKALEICWSAERPVPASEREFRALFWRQIVRAGEGGPAGLAQQREEVFQEIAVRRARALSPYVICKNLDPTVVASLAQDSLVISSEDNPSLLATAHDVLEDWAILQWLEDQHLIGEGSFGSLSSAIGTHPAIRRAYRHWVAELIERTPDDADRLLLAAVFETKITAQFRDDTLVSLLKASSSTDFLARHEKELLTNGATALKRIIQLLRVACVKTPDWIPGTSGHGSILNIPDGHAWASVLLIVHSNIETFTVHDHPLLLGLIEDAVRGASWWEPEPDGAECIAGIAHRLLPHFDNYRSDDYRKRTLKVIARIPKADPESFERILRGCINDGSRRNHVTDELSEIIFSGVEGMPTVRDLPDLFVSVGKEYLLATENDVLRNPYSWSPHEIELYFGIKDARNFGFFPASAYRGPWISFLQYHPKKALNFIIEVFNHSMDWYAHPRGPDPLEEPWETKLTFPDGSTTKHWVNARLWNLYRGTSVGPEVLKSILMALEKWLLEFAQNNADEVDAILVDILRRTESSMLSAVVASIATAYPHASGEALLALLSAPEYITLDRARMASEHQTTSLSDMLTYFKAENKIYNSEREDSNRLPHRQRDIETAIANLQFGALASRIHAIIDQHLSALPPKSAQDRDDLLWRLALHRMDLRQYIVSDAEGTGMPEEENNPDRLSEQYIRLEPKTPDDDVQALVNQNITQQNETNAKLAILMWGVKVFERETSTHDPSQWKEMLAQAKELEGGPEDTSGIQHAPGFVAAVCVRDHWDGISDKDKNWCINIICSGIMKHSSNWNHFVRVQRYSIGADRPSAFVISTLLTKSLGQQQTEKVRIAFITAMTHPVEEVRWYATGGVNEAFWNAYPDLALRAANAIAMEATLIDRAMKAEEDVPYEERRHFDKISEESAAAIRDYFWQEGAITEDAHTKVTISKEGAKANGRILAIFSHVPNRADAVAAYSRTSRALVDAWSARYDYSERGNYQEESSSSNLVRSFVLRTSSEAALTILRPILDATDHHPEEVHSIIEGLTIAEDRNPNTSHYWYLWKLFADQVRDAKWLNHLKDEHPMGSEMLSAIFLTNWWKDNVRHWKSLEGYDDNIHELFEDLPPSSAVLDRYMRFLYHIGEQSLPAAFIRVSKSLEHGDPHEMLKDSNTVYILEVLLQRYIYGRPLELKRDAPSRHAILFLLDTLVENGSSAAFRMRDDFVTPSS